MKSIVDQFEFHLKTKSRNVYKDKCGRYKNTISIHRVKEALQTSNFSGMNWNETDQFPERPSIVQWQCSSLMAFICLIYLDKPSLLSPSLILILCHKYYYEKFPFRFLGLSRGSNFYFYDCRFWELETWSIYTCIEWSETLNFRILNRFYHCMPSFLNLAMQMENINPRNK